MLQKSDIIEFTKELLLDYELHGVLQVGSTARGYAMQTSDVDLMAFYQTDRELISKPTHTSYRGIKVTLEHHDLQSFMLETLDHRFNIASLRQLHKIRDGIALDCDNHLRTLIDVAKLAHLDKTVLLNALTNVAHAWPLVSGANVAYGRQLLIRWAELLGTLDLMTRPNSVAYSKPKWLYMALKQAHLHAAVDLLELLYVPTDEHIKRMRDGLENIAAKYAGSIDDRYRKLIDTTLNDARTMLNERPTEAGPAVRFVGLLLYKFVFMSDPLERLRDSQSFQDDDFNAIFESEAPKAYDHHKALAQFLAYSTELTERVQQHLEAERNPAIGTTRLMGHILDSYSASDLLPLNFRTSIYKSLDIVVAWLDEAAAKDLAGTIA